MSGPEMGPFSKPNVSVPQELTSAEKLPGSDDTFGSSALIKSGKNVLPVQVQTVASVAKTVQVNFIQK